MLSYLGAEFGLDIVKCGQITVTQPFELLKHLLIIFSSSHIIRHIGIEGNEAADKSAQLRRVSWP